MALDGRDEWRTVEMEGWRCRGVEGRWMFGEAPKRQEESESTHKVEICRSGNKLKVKEKEWRGNDEDN